LIYCAKTVEIYSIELLIKQIFSYILIFGLIFSIRKCGTISELFNYITEITFSKFCLNKTADPSGYF